MVFRNLVNERSAQENLGESDRALEPLAQEELKWSHSADWAFWLCEQPSHQPFSDADENVLLLSLPPSIHPSLPGLGCILLLMF